MLKHLFKNLGFALFALSALAIAGCSAIPAYAQQASATATAAPTETATLAPTTTPAVRAPTRPRAAQLVTANIPLAQLRQLGFTVGIVVANDRDSLELRLGRTFEQLQIGPATLIVVPGIKDAKISDIKVGDRVIADMRGSDSNSIPKLVLDFPQGYTTNNVMIGLVIVNARGIATLRTHNESQDITPTATTVVVNMLGNQPALGNIKDATRGDAAVVIGQKTGDQFSPQVIVLLNRAALLAGRKLNQPAATPTP